MVLCPSKCSSCSVTTYIRPPPSTSKAHGIGYIRFANQTPASDRFDAQNDTLAHSTQGSFSLSSPPKVPAPAFRLHLAVACTALSFLSATARPPGAASAPCSPASAGLTDCHRASNHPGSPLQISPFSLHLSTDCKLLPLFSRFVNPTGSECTSGHYIYIASAHSTHHPPTAPSSATARSAG